MLMNLRRKVNKQDPAAGSLTSYPQAPGGRPEHCLGRARTIGTVKPRPIRRATDFEQEPSRFPRLLGDSTLVRHGFFFFLEGGAASLI